MHLQHTSSSAKVIGVVLDTSLRFTFCANVPFTLFSFSFSFFWHAFNSIKLKVRLLFINSNHNIWLFNSFSAASVDPCTVHETHKLHFSATFSLKMGLIVLFIHLKIILLQCFQFSAKINSIQTQSYFQTWSTLRSCPKQRF